MLNKTPKRVCKPNATRCGGRTRLLAMIGAAMLVHAGSAIAQADAYPSKPVRIVVGFPPGSATDVAARRVAQHMSTQLGKSFYVENKPGAGGSLAAEQVAKAPPDGYTIYAGTVSEIAINRPGGMKIRYDPQADFAPVGMLFATNAVILGSNSSGFKTLKDMVSAAKAKPGSVNVAAVNGFQQVVVSSIERAAGIKLNVIYYKGTALALNDVLGGQIDGMVGYPAESMANVSAGKAQALAIIGDKKNPFMPDTPTGKDVGVNTPNLIAWGAFFVPKGTPEGIVHQLNRAVVSANISPDIKSALAKTGSEAPAQGTAEFTKFVEDEIVKWERVVKETGFRFE